MVNDPSHPPISEEGAKPLSAERASPEMASPEMASPETLQNPTFGWNVYAEKINGRFAMVGFVALLLLELFTRQDFFTWLGF